MLFLDSLQVRHTQESQVKYRQRYNPVACPNIMDTHFRRTRPKVYSDDSRYHIDSIYIVTITLYDTMRLQAAIYF